MMDAPLDPKALLDSVTAFRDRMAEHQDEVNGLNVFPVPDGDTGTNVLLTLEAALAAVDPPTGALPDPLGDPPAVPGLGIDPHGTGPGVPHPASTGTNTGPGVPDPDAGIGPGCTGSGINSPLSDGRSAFPASPGKGPLSLSAVCEGLTRGIIPGARGSSGVILSQAVVAGLAVIADSSAPPNRTLAAAIQRARNAAYGAVAQPVEGTILTVLSAAADAASSAADMPLPDLTELVAVEAREAVIRTPALLPVLARAGVVDSGGRALSYGLDALAEVMGGRRLPPPPPVGRALLTPGDAGGASGASLAAQALHNGRRYEVVASLTTDESGATLVRDRWQQLGEAVVVSGAERTWRGHVHTDNPDAAVMAACEILGADALGEVTVTDLHAQIAEQAREARVSVEHAEESTTLRRVAGTVMGVVAVVEGAGMVQAYTDLGASVVETRDAAPSVQDLLDAMGRCDAQEVIVLPNDSNTVPAARQAQKLADRPMHVLPTRDPLVGLATLVVFEPAADATTNLETMRAVLQRTRGGRVAPVVRESMLAFGRAHPGQWLAIANREAVAVGQTPVEAALALVGHLSTPDTAELITIAWGRASTEEQVTRLRAELAERNPEDVVDVFNGGHHDAFLISVEDLGDDLDAEASNDEDSGSTGPGAETSDR